MPFRFLSSHLLPQLTSHLNAVTHETKMSPYGFFGLLGLFLLFSPRTCVSSHCVFRNGRGTVKEPASRNLSYVFAKISLGGGSFILIFPHCPRGLWEKLMTFTLMPPPFPLLSLRPSLQSPLRSTDGRCCHLPNFPPKLKRTLLRKTLQSPSSWLDLFWSAWTRCLPLCSSPCCACCCCCCSSIQSAVSALHLPWLDQNYCFSKAASAFVVVAAAAVGIRPLSSSAMSLMLWLTVFGGSISTVGVLRSSCSELESPIVALAAWLWNTPAARRRTGPASNQGKMYFSLGCFVSLCTG